MGGGKGGGSYVAGYKYKSGMMFILSDIADKVLGIWYQDKQAWVGDQNSGIINVDAPSLLGGDDREGGISGAFEIRDGNPNQGASSYLASNLQGKLVPAYRGLFCLLARKVYWGNSPYLKPIKFRIQRIMNRAWDKAQWYPEKAAIGLEMNPAHIIRECLTEQFGNVVMPESEIDDESFRSAADKLHAEGLGLSIMFTNEESTTNFIAEVLRHIDAMMFEDPTTGKQVLKLIREDYDPLTIPILDSSNSNLKEWSRSDSTNLISQITVEYYNRDGLKDSSVVAQDIAAISMTGNIINQTMKYSGIKTDAIAQMVAQRDLSRMSRQFKRGKILTNKIYYDLKPGDVFIISYPEDGIYNVICRITKRIDSGLLDGQITLEWGEDIFGDTFSTYAPPPPAQPNDVNPDAENFPNLTAFEVPYPILVQKLGEAAAAALPEASAFFGFAGSEPYGSPHYNYAMWSYPAASGPVFDPAQSHYESFTPTAMVDQDFSGSDEYISFTMNRGVEAVRRGQFVIVGDGLDSEREIIAIDDDSSISFGSMKIKRGTCGTAPREIPFGTILYFVGAVSGRDSRDYLASDTIEGYGAPKNASGEYKGPFTFKQVTMVGLAGLPYPPSHVKVNGVLFPDYVNGDMLITWAARDRVSQSDNAIGAHDPSSFPPPAGSKWSIKVYADDKPMVNQEVDSTVLSYSVPISTEYGIVNGAQLPMRLITFTNAQYSPPSVPARDIRIELLGKDVGGDYSNQTSVTNLKRAAYGINYGNNYQGGIN